MNNGSGVLVAMAKKKRRNIMREENLVGTIYIYKK